MMTQARFPNLVPSHQIKADAEAREPLMWVRELRVLKDLQPGDGFIARRLELRRGLNVVWAHPVPSGGDDVLFENVLQGHTAGKTTFCRILRYALGEDQFGDDATREAIRQSEELGKGWVVAEVHVEEIPWVVARPFQIGPHPFCIRGATIDALFEKNLPHEDFNSYRKALDRAATRNLPVKDLPGSNLALNWHDLLAWLSRDQECRLSHLLEWRHSASDSGSAKHDRDARELLVRSVLNIVSEQENKELAENERLLEKKDKARKQSPLLRHQARSDRLFLEEKFGAQLPEFDDGLFSDAVLVPLNSLAAQIKKQRDSLPWAEEMKAVQKAYADAVGAESRAAQDLANARDKFRSEEAVLKAAQENKSGETHKALFNRLPPTSEYCNVPIREAIDGGCELAKLRCLDFSEEKAKLNFELEVKRQEQIVAAHQRVVEQKIKDHNQAELAAAASRNMWDSAQKIRMAGMEHAIAEEQRLGFLRDLAARASKAWKDAAECDSSLPKIEADIRECQARQEMIRQQHQTALGNFSQLFDYVMRALLGQEISGSVDLSGRNVALEIEYHGQRRSTAINTLKFTVFDVAALVGGIEGRNFHPRFLLHDCPREADMDAAIYRKLFVFALELERIFKGESNFQYIITTTETPPTSVRKRPWLIQELDASRPETRFLGVDL